jgi:predicted enzyme related to lactoylglutathione lyase
MTDGSEKTVRTTGFDFVMVLVKDMTRARAFYEALFGVVPGSIASEYFVEYDLPDGNTFALGRDPNADFVPIGGAVFGVPDVNAAVERVKELGGALVRTYGGDICTSGWCTDPEGNAFGVHQRLP